MALPVRVARAHVADPFDVVRRDLNQVFGRLFSAGNQNDQADPMGLASFGSYGVDIREDADHIYVEADLPGFRKEDVDISLENGTLSILAERREEVAEPAADGKSNQESPQQGASRESQSRDEYLLRERRIERFVRSFTLPPTVDEQHVEARMENGVLKITLNKRENAKPRRVQVS